MALQIQGQTLKTGAPGPSFPQDQQGALLATELNPRYYQNIYQNQTFAAQVANANPTGVTTGILGAAGTPLLLVWNPAGTGKNLVILNAVVAGRNNGTVSPGSFVWSAGLTTAITANLSTPINLLNYQLTGSVAKFVANAAATGLSALNYIRPITGMGAGTTATTTGFQQAFEDTAGSILVPPGAAAAIISTVTGTAAVVDAGITWVEVNI